MRRAVLLFIALTLGCRARSQSAEASGPGVLSVRWTGSRTGRFSAPAEARWCARDTLLELVAARSDTAIGISLVAQDSVRAGAYPVYVVGADPSRRPQAGAAMRWVDSTEIRRYNGARGQVILSEGGARRVSGTLEIGLTGVTIQDSVHLTGSFSGVAIVPAGPACGRANKPGRG